VGELEASWCHGIQSSVTYGEGARNATMHLGIRIEFRMVETQQQSKWCTDLPYWEIG
jgi:hypothetical protein